MLPYEKTNLVFESDAGEIHEIPFPTRVSLTKLIVVSAAEASYDVDLYNRAFTADPVTIASITDDGEGETSIRFLAQHGLMVGDPFVVAGNSVAGYNTTHRVASVEDEYTVVTDQTYTADGTGGTGTLAITGNEQELYRVLATKASASKVVSYISDEGTPFFNHDKPVGGRQPRKIYIKFEKADTYRVTLGAVSPEAQG
jgi:hypothetical protein